ncbi:type II toxin-antitoxin system prevent-host-death family antitoxin [Arvimicrobium flavum]|uniref:type II toxin-antitoxin system prevent-host-death family antitoxin n=1 Tax=Arvimicrobium flavum TaxID=3393320 RepID=UPI00237B53AB|nr:type II toxin-antitoxin system prevent-host-death family antitoxin [Mesorhizobium shangrilense]
MNVVRAPVTTMSSREFNQDTARAKRAAKQGPVFITDRGKPSHVLLTKDEYDRLEALQAPAEAPKRKSLARALADLRPEADFDWEPPRLSGFSLKVPDSE